MSLPPNWVTAVSKSTGATYWFNTKTNQSQYTPPTAVDASAPPPLGVLRPAREAAPVPAPAPASASFPWSQYAARNAAILSAGSDIVALRVAAAAVCAAVRASVVEGSGGGGGGGAAPLVGVHRFPPIARELKAALFEAAEDEGLRAESVGVDPLRHVIVWAAGGARTPPEVAEIAREEALLLAEAAAARAKEVADAAAVAAAALEAGGGARGCGGAGRKRERERNTAVEVEAERAEPLFAPRHDRRSFAEIQADLAAKKAANPERTKKVKKTAVVGSAVGGAVGAGGKGAKDSSTRYAGFGGFGTLVRDVGGEEEEREEEGGDDDDDAESEEIDIAAG